MTETKTKDTAPGGDNTQYLVLLCFSSPALPNITTTWPSFPLFLTSGRYETSTSSPGGSSNSYGSPPHILSVPPHILSVLLMSRSSPADLLLNSRSSAIRVSIIILRRELSYQEKTTEEWRNSWSRRRQKGDLMLLDPL